ncbi:MAG: hypothetical protein WBM70_07335 [Sulfurovum sp.]|uniref:hypothetical protein n=1 Tax=Sulfurovum sp. TaxID=1969726 RepID=UPI003C7111CE
MNIKKSLQALKTDLAHKETTLKTIQHLYPHLVNLSEKQVLSYFNVTTIEELKEHIQDSIKTSTEYEIDRATLCSCKDSKGECKELYDTQEIAQEKADQLMTHQMLKLRVYPCPFGYGWHLTKG